VEFGPVILSVGPVTMRRHGSVEGTIEKVDRYGLLRRQMAAKGEKLESEEARRQVTGSVVDEPAAAPQFLRGHR
jgi:hypothetical protein